MMSAFERQFDFWIGEWDALDPAGQRVGQNRISAILGGRAIHEHWTDTEGREGLSLNLYSALDGRWHQTWVDDRGSLRRFSGGLEDQRMVMSAEVRSPSDPKLTVLLRITWQVMDEDRVRQHSEFSRDGGATWLERYDLRYTRKP